MKIITLNTHSLLEPDYEWKLEQFAHMICAEQPDVFGLQEVNQSLEMPEAEPCRRAEGGMGIPEAGYLPCKGEEAVVRSDNHALRLAKLLREQGMPYEWTWIPAKIGYGIYEEGLALFSRQPITDTRQFYISAARDRKNWKTRKVLGIRTGNLWFYSLHAGWWDDEEEPFAPQWDRFLQEIHADADRNSPCFVMGDFNNPAEIKGGGYGYVKASGWHDTWCLAEEKDDGITVEEVIDGWRERMEETDRPVNGMRIDFIWCSQVVPVLSSRVVCNGKNYPVVSDHFGVEAEIML